MCLRIVGEIMDLFHTSDQDACFGIAEQSDSARPHGSTSKGNAEKTTVYALTHKLQEKLDTGRRTEGTRERCVFVGGKNLCHVCLHLSHSGCDK